MTRNIFILLIILPFIAAFFITPGIYFLVIGAVYLMLIQFVRLSYLNFNLKEILLAYTPFGLITWLKMWEKDNTE